jgi:pentatricopeptide repeat protein
MAFNSMVGKELLEMDYHGLEEEGKTIFSSYVHTSGDNGDETTTTTVSNDDDDNDSSVEDHGAISEEERNGVAQMKTSRPAMGGMFNDPEDSDYDSTIPTVVESNGHTIQGGTVAVDDDDKSDGESEKKPPSVKKLEVGHESSEAKAKSTTTTTVEPRRRFRDSLNALQIEEAKATGRAQLGLAFEMLTMMKKRALKTDPEAYQSLIDACGRVGDTKRATELLGRMHEDGIVADGTVYACLVSAFSADTAWRNGTKEEDLPGKCVPSKERIQLVDCLFSFSFVPGRYQSNIRQLLMSIVCFDLLFQNGPTVQQ